MRYSVVAGLILLTSLSMTACARLGFANHSHDYVKNSQQISPLVVPPTVKLKKDTYYRVPNTRVSLKQKAVSVVPPTLK